MRICNTITGPMKRCYLEIIRLGNQFKRTILKRDSENLPPNQQASTHKKVQFKQAWIHIFINPKYKKPRESVLFTSNVQNLQISTESKLDQHHFPFKDKANSWNSSSLMMRVGWVGEATLTLSFLSHTISYIRKQRKTTLSTKDRIIKLELLMVDTLPPKEI